MFLTTYSVVLRAALFHFDSMPFQPFTGAAPCDTMHTAISSDKSQHTNLCFVGSSQRQTWNAHCERVKVGCRGLAGWLLRVLGLEKYLQAADTSSNQKHPGTVSSTWSTAGSCGSCVSEDNIQNTQWQKIGDDLSRLYIEVYYRRVIQNVLTSMAL